MFGSKIIERMRLVSSLPDHCIGLSEEEEEGTFIFSRASH